MTKATELAELCAILGQHLPDWGTSQVVELATSLRRLAARNSRAAVLACNEPGYQDAATACNDRVIGKAATLLQGTGIGVTGCDDARGYALHLHFPSGRYNTMGGKEQGWGI